MQWRQTGARSAGWDRPWHGAEKGARAARRFDVVSTQAAAPLTAIKPPPGPGSHAPDEPSQRHHKYPAQPLGQKMPCKALLPAEALQRCFQPYAAFGLKNENR